MNKQIFIAEDDVAIVDIYRHIFGDAGFGVVVAVDGQDAMEKLKSTGVPSIILLDIMMPKATGFEVLKFIKSRDSLRDIPVMFVTNLRAPEHIQKGLDLGADKFLVKSENDTKQILNTVIQLLEEKSIKN